jgi:hypothetical protein
MYQPLTPQNTGSVIGWKGLPNSGLLQPPFQASW